MNKNEAYKIVYDDLIKNNLFIGKYDNKNGSSEFMSGVYTVMLNIAYNSSEECAAEFSSTFLLNEAKSEKDHN